MDFNTGIVWLVFEWSIAFGLLSGKYSSPDLNTGPEFKWFNESCIDRVWLNNQLAKILQVVIPFIFYPFYLPK